MSGASPALCYADPPTGVHLTLNGRETMCGLAVKDVPVVPRTVEALRCRDCHERQQERLRDVSRAEL